MSAPVVESLTDAELRRARALDRAEHCHDRERVLMGWDDPEPEGHAPHDVT